MKIFWGLLSIVICCGCVAGPGDFASKSADDSKTQAAANDAEVAEESEVVQVSSTSLEDRPEFKTTSSGLKYRILKTGKGRKPNANSTVTCHYKGWLDNGEEFDSSYSRNQTSTFPLSDVIKGWTEGLQLIQEGGMIELEIPSSMGYGPKGSPPSIPPNATLHFDIELFKVR